MEWIVLVGLICLGAPIYFNRMCNIIFFCMPANTILTTVFPSAVVRFSLSPLMYPTSVCYFVCLFPSFFRSVLIAEISSSLSFFVVVVFYHLQQKSHSHCYYMYCPLQELVNLLITGKAVSNTFDNIMEVDTGGSKKVQYLRQCHERYSSSWLVYKGFRLSFVSRLSLRY